MEQSTKLNIPFNKRYHAHNELVYLSEVIKTGHFSSGGVFSKACENFFLHYFHDSFPYFTNSCTDALEMAAILIDIKEGDEVILPSYTFVSTANAFLLRGAKLIFADSCSDHPNIDIESVQNLISPKTKAIVVVHYAGVPIDFTGLKTICQERNIFLIEDAAQALGSSRDECVAGKIGDIACFSFHDTKVISCGEGGLLVLNRPDLKFKADLIYEKGTNRREFQSGEADKYSWKSVGSSFAASELQAAVLLAQCDELHDILSKRRELISFYHQELNSRNWNQIKLKWSLPEKTRDNGSIYFVVLENLELRISLLKHFIQNGVQATFHYLCLHQSPFFKENYIGKSLKNADYFEKGLVRLPLYTDLNTNDQKLIIELLKEWDNNQPSQI